MLILLLKRHYQYNNIRQSQGGMIIEYPILKYEDYDVPDLILTINPYFLGGAEEKKQN